MRLATIAHGAAICAGDPAAVDLHFRFPLEYPVHDTQIAMAHPSLPLADFCAALALENCSRL